ncbi:MAG: response regulator transcription factor [Caldilineales bacterium]|nr:response regulator transcription factor [Caldilineales bacterium]
MAKVRVLLADDHALFREGLAGIIAAQPDMEVVGEARDGLEAVVKARELQPDLVLMDVQMPGMDGLEATLQIKRALPRTTIVMLTVRDDDDKLLAALKGGAQGYLLKDIRSRDLLEMLRAALRGEAALNPRLAGRVLAEFRRMSRQGPSLAAEGEEVLSRREREVLELAARGLTDKEIAEALVISLYTVKSHIRSILAKLQVSSRQEAARLARQKGLV